LKSGKRIKPDVSAKLKSGLLDVKMSYGLSLVLFPSKNELNVPSVLFKQLYRCNLLLGARVA
jgi:hypothetical protein